MASGGHGRSGPPPDPNALRRDRKSDQASWVTLPAEGRKGEPPDWPLSKPTARELHWWRELWTRPQAVMWERLGLQVEVAMYARKLTLGEARNAPVNLGTLLRQMGDALGLTIPGMRTHRWKISTDEVATKRAEQQPAEAAPSVRDRFRVVNGGA